MKQKITEQSILLFEKKGFSQTSIQDIVNELDVTKGTFYYYFSSKEQLLMDIHRDYIVDLVERQQKIMDNTMISEKEKLIQMIELLLKDIPDKGPAGRVFFREFRNLKKEHLDEIKAIRNDFRKNIERIIRNGIDKKEFRGDLDPNILTFGVLGVTNYTYNWYRPAGEVSLDEMIDIYAQMIITGLENKDEA